ncbi:MAG: large conductance mechanosensitive channel protein MscL [Acidimicrobiales bacterium]
MLKEFKAFILQGNVVMLAVAVVIGVAFQAVIKAIVADILTPLISIPGKANFESLSFTIHGSTFLYGDVLNEIIAFLAVAIAVFFIVVKPYNVSQARKAKTEEATTRDCPACLTEVPLAATRCAACTSDLPPVATEAG